MLASEWYAEFQKWEWDNEILLKEERNGYRNTDTDKKWTKFIEKFLADLGKSKGYEIKSDFESPVRIDMTWDKNGQTEVAIEHENNGGSDSIKREIEKLANNTDAKIRVLITYLKDDKFPEELRKLRLKVTEALQHKRPEFELVLMVAPWHMERIAEFACFLYQPFFQEIYLPQTFPRT